MTKNNRFTLSKDTEWWFIQDNTIQVNEYGYRDDLSGEDKYRGLKKELTEEEVVELLNELYKENIQLKNKSKFINELNKPYGAIIGENMRLKTFIKRFIDDEFEAIEDLSFTDTDTGEIYSVDYFDEIIELLNELNGENRQLKQLIHTILTQINIEKVNTENTRYSARIIFTFEQFKKIRQIWKGDVE